MNKIIEDFIKRHHLLSAGDKVVVGLSGGADSVALLHLLTQAGFCCEAAHCNFHLRGAESDRDENFVRQLCTQWHVPLHITHFDTSTVAQQRHISIEMAARELRYHWFETLRQELGAAAIAIAHHQDDSIETFLLNLMRGTGIGGLRGIRPRNGYIIRPLLCVGRKDIEDYLRRINQPYVTDSSNLQDEYLRNKIRLHLLPLMQDINPSIKSSLIQTSHYMAEAFQVYQQGICLGKQRVLTPEGIDIDKLRDEPSPEALLHEILSPLGFNSAQIEDIHQALDGQPGKVFTSSAGFRIVKDRHLLLIAPVKSGEDLPPTLHIEKKHYDASSFIIPKRKDILCVDAGKLTQPLTLRRYRPGDVFVPFGMKGRKKVSDYLTDRKFSLPQREALWILCCGEAIVWLVNERADNRFRIDEHTTEVWIIRIDDTHPSC